MEEGNEKQRLNHGLTQKSSLGTSCKDALNPPRARNATVGMDRHLQQEATIPHLLVGRHSPLLSPKVELGLVRTKATMDFDPGPGHPSWWRLWSSQGGKPALLRLSAANSPVSLSALTCAACLPPTTLLLLGLDHGEGEPTRHRKERDRRTSGGMSMPRVRWTIRTPTVLASW